MANMGKLKNRLPRDKSSWLLVIPLLIVGALGIMAFDAKDSLMGTTTNGTPTVSRPVELSFSDVLRRAKDIKTMNIRGSDATGVLDDGIVVQNRGGWGQYYHRFIKVVF